ncbi:MAG TPA: CRISPR-associated endonuclease Cas2 [Clostridia bacterium]|nr:CRISPR-associated endonuclease Cas2 [Clostridia bacterium]
MLVLITYDMQTIDKKGRSRLRWVAKECQNYGQRVQNSVFEINTDYANILILKDKLLNIIDKDKDSIRIYYLGNHWEKKVEHFGVKESYNPEGLLLI